MVLLQPAVVLMPWALSSALDHLLWDVVAGVQVTNRAIWELGSVEGDLGVDARVHAGASAPILDDEALGMCEGKGLMPGIGFARCEEWWNESAEIVWEGLVVGFSSGVG